MSTSKLIYRDIAPGAVESAAVETADANALSAPALLLTGVSEAKYAALEPNAWLLDGSRTIYDGGQIVFWSERLSGADGTFEANPQITIETSEQFSSSGLTLIFDEATGNYCTHINIQWYQQDTLKVDADFYPTGTTYYCNQSVESYDKIVITLKKTSLPYRRARLTRFLFGANREFPMDMLRNVKITQQIHPISLELPIGAMSWALEDDSDINYIFQFKQPVEAWGGDSLIGVYYINTSSRSSSTLYNIECVDALGILDETGFPGGYYAAASAQQMILDIVGGTFDVDFRVGDTTLTGVIQAGSKRAALQQVLFAMGACAAADGYEIRVFALDDLLSEIGDGRTYTGATLSTESIVTSVSVTAHTYTPSDNGEIEINGQKYTDAKTVYTVNNPNITPSDKANEKAITDATLISPDIGQATAQRVYDYYARRSTASAKIVLLGELIGDCVSVPNPWGEATEGNITKMEITLSNTVAADIELVGM